MHDQFQRERDGKIKQIKMTYKQKIESQTDNRKKSHQKDNIYMRASPRRKSALSRLYKALALRYGEANNRRTGYEPSRKDIDNAKDSQKDRDGGEANSTHNTSSTPQSEKKLVPFPLENLKRIEALNTLAQDLEA